MELPNFSKDEEQTLSFNSIDRTSVELPEDFQPVGINDGYSADNSLAPGVNDVIKEENSELEESKVQFQEAVANIIPKEVIDKQIEQACHEQLSQQSGFIMRIYYVQGQLEKLSLSQIIQYKKEGVNLQHYEAKDVLSQYQVINTMTESQTRGNQQMFQQIIVARPQCFERVTVQTGQQALLLWEDIKQPSFSQRMKIPFTQLDSHGIQQMQMPVIGTTINFSQVRAPSYSASYRQTPYSMQIYQAIKWMAENDPTQQHVAFFQQLVTQINRNRLTSKDMNSQMLRLDKVFDVKAYLNQQVAALVEKRQELKTEFQMLKENSQQRQLSRDPFELLAKGYARRVYKATASKIKRKFEFVPSLSFSTDAYRLASRPPRPNGMTDSEYKQQPYNQVQNITQLIHRNFDEIAPVITGPRDFFTLFYTMLPYYLGLQKVDSNLAQFDMLTIQQLASKNSITSTNPTSKAGPLFDSSKTQQQVMDDIYLMAQLAMEVCKPNPSEWLRDMIQMKKIILPSWFDYEKPFHQRVNETVDLLKCYNVANLVPKYEIQDEQKSVRNVFSLTPMVLPSIVYQHYYQNFVRGKHNMYKFQMVAGQFDQFVKTLFTPQLKTDLNPWYAYSDNVYVKMVDKGKAYWLSFDMSSAEVSSTTTFVQVCQFQIDYYVKTGQLLAVKGLNPLDIKLDQTPNQGSTLPPELQNYMFNVYPHLALNSRAILNGHVFHVPGQQSGNPLTFHNNQHRSTILGQMLQFMDFKHVVNQDKGVLFLNPEVRFMAAKLAYADIKLERCQELNPNLDYLDLDLLGYSAVKEPITGAWIPVLQFDRIAKATAFDKASDFVSRMSKAMYESDKKNIDSETRTDLSKWGRILGNALRVIKMTQLYILGGWYYAPRIYLTFILSAKVANKDMVQLQDIMNNQFVLNSMQHWIADLLQIERHEVKLDVLTQFLTTKTPSLSVVFQQFMSQSDFAKWVEQKIIMANRDPQLSVGVLDPKLSDSFQNAYELQAQLVQDSMTSVFDDILKTEQEYQRERIENYRPQQMVQVGQIHTFIKQDQVYFDSRNDDQNPVVIKSFNCTRSYELAFFRIQELVLQSVRRDNNAALPMDNFFDKFRNSVQKIFVGFQWEHHPSSIRPIVFNILNELAEFIKLDTKLASQSFIDNVSQTKFANLLQQQNSKYLKAVFTIIHRNSTAAQMQQAVEYIVKKKTIGCKVKAWALELILDPAKEIRSQERNLVVQIPNTLQTVTINGNMNILQLAVTVSIFVRMQMQQQDFSFPSPMEIPMFGCQIGDQVQKVRLVPAFVAEQYIKQRQLNIALDVNIIRDILVKPPLIRILKQNSNSISSAPIVAMQTLIFKDEEQRSSVVSNVRNKMINGEYVKIIQSFPSMIVLLQQQYPQEADSLVNEMSIACSGINFHQCVPMRFQQVSYDARTCCDVLVCYYFSNYERQKDRMLQFTIEQALKLFMIYGSTNDVGNVFIQKKINLKFHQILDKLYQLEPSLENIFSKQVLDFKVTEVVDSESLNADGRFKLIQTLWQIYNKMPTVPNEVKVKNQLKGSAVVTAYNLLVQQDKSYDDYNAFVAELFRLMQPTIRINKMVAIKPSPVIVESPILSLQPEKFKQWLLNRDWIQHSLELTGFKSYTFSNERFVTKQQKVLYQDQQIFELTFVPFFNLEELEQNYKSFLKQPKKLAILLPIPGIIESFFDINQAAYHLRKYKFKTGSTFDELVEYIDSFQIVEDAGTQSIDQIANNILAQIKQSETDDQAMQIINEYCKNFNSVSTVFNTETADEIKSFFLDSESKAWTNANFQLVLQLFATRQDQGLDVYSQLQKVDLANSNQLREAK